MKSIVDIIESREASKKILSRYDCEEIADVLGLVTGVSGDSSDINKFNGIVDNETRKTLKSLYDFIKAGTHSYEEITRVMLRKYREAFIALAKAMGKSDRLEDNYIVSDVVAKLYGEDCLNEALLYEGKQGKLSNYSRDALSELVGIIIGAIGEDDDIKKYRKLVDSLSKEEQNQLNELYDVLSDKQTYPSIDATILKYDIPVLKKIYKWVDDNNTEKNNFDLYDAFSKITESKVNEGRWEKPTTGDGSIEMVSSIIDELRKHPDMKGRDKELWASTGQFLWDYLKQLDEKTLQNIMDTFGLVKMSDWKGCKPHDVQLGLWAYLSQKEN